MSALADSLRRLARLLEAFGGVEAELAGRLRALLGGAARSIPLLGGAAADVLAEPPAVRELDPSVLGAATSAYLAGDLDRVGGPCDVAALQTAVDGIGGGDRSAVDIHRVLAGSPPTPRWIVNLPSTQDWNSLNLLLGDDGHRLSSERGATNDFDADVALLVSTHPALRTQYERAVLEAMRQAGVRPDEPVMLCGFSLGGIMAANLAANSTAYRWTDVLAYGAPIDGFAIPPSVRVEAFQFASDPVPGLDGRVVPHRGGAWDATVVPDQPGATGLHAHSAVRYQQAVCERLGGTGFGRDFVGPVTARYVATWSE